MLPNNPRLVLKVYCNNNNNNNDDNVYCDTEKTEINRNISGMWKTKPAETAVISSRLRGLLACPDLCCDRSQHTTNISEIFQVFTVF